jgi:hypothetical protein
MHKRRLTAGSVAARVQHGVAIASIDVPKSRQVHKEGEVNISAYFPAEVKASLRMVQAKTGNNVKECLTRLRLRPTSAMGVLAAVGAEV